MPIEQDPGELYGQPEQDPRELYGRLTDQARRNLVPFDPTPEDKGVVRVMKSIAAGLLTSQAARHRYQQQTDEYFRISQHLEALKEEQKRAKEAHALSVEKANQALEIGELSKKLTGLNIRKVYEEMEAEKPPVKGTEPYYEALRREEEIRAKFREPKEAPVSWGQPFKDESGNLLQVNSRGKIEKILEGPKEDAEKVKELRSWVAKLHGFNEMTGISKEDSARIARDAETARKIYDSQDPTEKSVETASREALNIGSIQDAINSMPKAQKGVIGSNKTTTVTKVQEILALGATVDIVKQVLAAKGWKDEDIAAIILEAGQTPLKSFVYDPATKSFIPK